MVMPDSAKMIREYVTLWRTRGYPDDIPDTVPDALMRENLAPSYKAICLAIMRNDVALESLGFFPKTCASYTALKRIELDARKEKHGTV